MPKDAKISYVARSVFFHPERLALMDVHPIATHNCHSQARYQKKQEIEKWKTC